MLLLLDVISPLPEFCIIEENKIIIQRKIVKKESDKLSDYIFQIFKEINDNLKITDNIKQTIMTIGPGSYTSLRVGAAFLSGLIISKDLTFCPISVEDIFNFKSLLYKSSEFGFYINSSQNQNFLCVMNNDKKIEYLKLDNKIKIKSNLKTIFYNFNKLNDNNKCSQIKFSFIDEILQNYQKLKFTKKSIIKPIYISNNKILN